MWPMFWLFYANPILIAAAVIPAIVLMVKVYQADRLEKESPGMMLSLVFFGIIATALAMVAERLGIMILSRTVAPNSTLYRVILYFGIVAFAEEGAKYILLKRRTWYSYEFNCQFDGVVYAVCVSLGFALWENIGYVLQYGLSTALVRAVTAVPGHACFGVFMGVFYGLAKRYDRAGKEGRSSFFRKLSLLAPALLHGCYDFIATDETTGYAMYFLVFVVALFAVAFLLVRKMSREDLYIR